VEFALLLPLLAFLLVVGIDFARVFYYSLTLWNCARQGALYASDPVAAAQSPYTSITQAALADAGGITPAPTVSSTSGVDSAKNPYVQVTVQWTFSTITNYPGVGDNFPLTRTIQVRVAPTVPN